MAGDKIYHYDLTIHSLTVFNDHDTPGNGEIFIKVLIDNDEIRIPKDSHYSMSDNDEVQVNWEQIFSIPSPVNILIEVREDDDGLDDSLGSFYLPNYNVTRKTFYTSNPSDAKLVISLLITITDVPTTETANTSSENTVEFWEFMLFIAVVSIFLYVVYYVGKKMME